MAYAKPCILAENLFAAGVPVASETAAGYDVRNIADDRTYTAWQGDGGQAKTITVDLGRACPADTVAVVGHNLHAGSVLLAVECSPVGIHWERCCDGFYPESDRACLRTFPQVSARWWRLLLVPDMSGLFGIDGFGDERYGGPPPEAFSPTLSVVHLGARLTFASWLADGYDPHPETIHGESHGSRTGQFLGCTVRYISLHFRAQFKRLTPAWVDTVFRPVWDDHLSRVRPFFWAWDITGHPAEIYYVRIPANGALSVPYDSVRQQLTLTMEGIKE